MSVCAGRRGAVSIPSMHPLPAALWQKRSDPVNALCFALTAGAAPTETLLDKFLDAEHGHMMAVGELTNLLSFRHRAIRVCQFAQ